MHLGTKIYTFFMGNYVGKDSYGNKYYSNKKDYSMENSKRWVIFKGSVEATKIPPHWHAWLHKITIDPPINYSHKYDWQKDHIVNKTGTKDAYYPDMHPLNKSTENMESKPEYESWNPE